ncbi:MAG: hypothetical protein A3E87_05955 [Gammaproteobacteria bacterium RIFCSPHIGHO2_12_FULL_35_23]|nr:MAG: hypothetical protein A3E87_05955 [Gammaproteobacteria bacterium RIFCSPHIGHO2_12_FULL_35_23]
MKFLRNIIGIGAVLLAASLQTFSTPIPNITSEDNEPYNYQKALHWIVAPNKYNICGGYYRDFPIPYTPNPIAPPQDANYDIHADNVLYSTKGSSILQGHVSVTRPDQQLNTNLAYLNRNKETGKIDSIDMYHGVKLFEPGSLLVGRYGHVDIPTKHVTIYNAAYRTNHTAVAPQIVTAVNKKTGQIEDRHYDMNYWGHAKIVEQTEPKHFSFKHATYTTCPPVGTCVWHLYGSTVNLNYKTDVGHAWNSLLFLHGIPIFYFPYISFPLTHKRKTGFLPPSYFTSVTSGSTYNLPFYWNIAPNYDLLTNFSYLQKRGFKISPFFRYLTNSSNGNAKLDLVPHDSTFAKFKKTSTDVSVQNASNFRYEATLNDNTTFNDHWSGSATYNRVSDDYYFIDLGSKLFNNSTNQLPQTANLQYQGLYWDFGGMVLNYQTLKPPTLQHPTDQYAYLPEFNASFSHPLPDNFNASVSSTATNFSRDTSVIGKRYTLDPSASYNFNRPYGTLNPQIQLAATDYQVGRNPGLPNSPGVIIPIFSTEGSLNFYRNFNWFGSAYQQTLVPQIQYTYIPYHNQNELPIFDTSGVSFNYSYLFATNRFAGYDRVGDANQIAYAITTGLINEMTGVSKGSFSIGQIRYLEPRRVTVCNTHGCGGNPGKSNSRNFSPVAGQGTYAFTPTLNTTDDLTWDPYSQTLNLSSILTYTPSPRHIFNLNYNFTKLSKNTTVNAASPTLYPQDLTVSGEWFLWRHVDLVGQWTHVWDGNQTENSGDAYLWGVEYDSCCWAVRFVTARTFQGVSTSASNMFVNSYYIQFDLKGLGSFANQNPGQLLGTEIPGYSDTFDQSIVG